MWLLVPILGFVYVAWKSQTSGQSTTDVLNDLYNEGTDYLSTAETSVSADGVINDLEDAVSATEDDVSSLAGSPSLTSKATIMAAASPYLPLIQSQAQASGWDPDLLIGIGWQESGWGTSRFLDVKSPGGTGDFTARAQTWGQAALANDPNIPITLITALPPGWVGKGTGPWYIPSDGRGFGRGLCQIDLPVAYKLQWDDPATNIRACTDTLDQKEAQVQSHWPSASHDNQITATVAAYNAGLSSAIIGAMNSGQSPASTYSNRVLGFANKVAS